MSKTYRVRKVGAALSVAFAFLAVTGCGSTDEANPAPAATPSGSVSTTAGTPTQDAVITGSPEPTADPITTVEVSINGDQITPNGERVEVGVGELLRLSVVSDRAGELHVHSNPEQTLSYGEGTSTLRLKVNNPGVIDMEDHESGTVIVQLVVCLSFE